MKLVRKTHESLFSFLKFHPWCSGFLQVDFPSSAVDVLYVGPKRAPSPDPHTLEELDPDLRRKLEKICSRASNFG